MNEFFKLLSALLGNKVAFDGEDGWITMNGTPVKVDGKGDPVAGPSNVVKQENKSNTLDFGEPFTAYSGKPKEAVSHLLKEKRGHVPAAFSKEGLGDIDLPYGQGGKNGFGLAHIMERRGSGGEEFVRALPDIVKEGRVERREGYPGRAYIVHDKREAVIRLDWDGEDRSWLLTAYQKKSPGAADGRQTSVHAFDGKQRIPSPYSGVDDQIIGTSFIKNKIHDSRREGIAFDRASRRHFDANGFLHVSLCHISKEQVADYYGSEIPGWQKLGLEPNRIYRGYRSASELAKAAATFNGLPLLNEHVKDSAEEPQKDLRIGNLGTDVAFRAPYLDNSLIIQDAEAIEALNPSEPGKAAKRELSASYRYDPVFKPGVFQGQRYDFIMTNIRGNHVALVEEGRAGSDVVVSDENTITKRKRTMGENILAQLKALVDALSGGGATVHPGGEEEAKAFVAGGEADDSDPNATNPEGAEDDEAEDLGVKLFAYLDNMEDQDLAAKVKEVIEAARASEAPAPVGDEDETAKDEDDPDKKEKDKPAMDRRPGKRGAQKSRSLTTNVANINLAMDAKAVAAQLVSSVRAGLRAQIEAAREVRPLVGELDPMAFDSAAGIYQKALGLIGRPTKVNDIRALREMCALARETKRSGSPYPVVSAALANDSKGDADPNFANLGSIRKA